MWICITFFQQKNFVRQGKYILTHTVGIFQILFQILVKKLSLSSSFCMESPNSQKGLCTTITDIHGLVADVRVHINFSCQNFTKILQIQIRNWMKMTNIHITKCTWNFGLEIGVQGEPHTVQPQLESTHSIWCIGLLSLPLVSHFVRAPSNHRNLMNHALVHHVRKALTSDSVSFSCFKFIHMVYAHSCRIAHCFCLWQGDGPCPGLQCQRRLGPSVQGNYNQSNFITESVLKKGGSKK